MATLASWRGINGDALVNLPVVGSRLIMAYARATLVAADDTAGTLAISFPNMRTITGFWVTILGAGNNLVGYGEAEGDVTGLDLTVSGNTLTLADGTSGYDLTAGDIIHILVVGPSKL
jgi:hypothetical protein